jgi:uncharacterized protein (DUF2147 family)
MSFPRLLLVFALLSATLAVHGQTGTIFGTWREPGGSMIEVVPCGADVCMKLAAISKSAPAQVDHNNPDPALRTRPLCGLQIGYAFHLTDPSHAERGKLYDPKSGKTYKGLMSATANTLALRGYIGLKSFGRTETWTRTPSPPPCKPHNER